MCCSTKAKPSIGCGTPAQWSTGADIIDIVERHAGLNLPRTGVDRTATVGLLFILMIMQALSRGSMFFTDICAQGLRLARCRMDEIGFRFRRQPGDPGTGKHRIVRYDALLNLGHVVFDSLDTSAWKTLFDSDQRPLRDEDGKIKRVPRPEHERRANERVLDEISQRLLRASVIDDDCDALQDADPDDLHDDGPFTETSPFIDGMATMDGTGHAVDGGSPKAEDISYSRRQDTGWRKHADGVPAVLGYNLYVIAGQIRRNGPALIANLRLAPGNAPEAPDGLTLAKRTISKWGIKTLVADRGFTNKDYLREGIWASDATLVFDPEDHQFDLWTDPVTGIIWWAGNPYRPGTPKHLFPADRRPVVRAKMDRVKYAEDCKKWDAAVARLDVHRLRRMQVDSRDPSKWIYHATTIGGLCVGCGIPVVKGTYGHHQTPAHNGVASVCQSVLDPDVDRPSISVALPHVHEDPGTHEERRKQAPPQHGYEYGTPTWVEFYKRLRALSESVFGIWKNPAGEGITGKRFRLTGITDNHFACVAWAVAYNLRMQKCMTKPIAHRDLLDQYVNDPHAGCFGPHRGPDYDKFCDHFGDDHTCDGSDPPEVA